jgi:hypothetical protein
LPPGPGQGQGPFAPRGGGGLPPGSDPPSSSRNEALGGQDPPPSTPAGKKHGRVECGTKVICAKTRDTHLQVIHHIHRTSSWERSVHVIRPRQVQGKGSKGGEAVVQAKEEGLRLAQVSNAQRGNCLT